MKVIFSKSNTIPGKLICLATRSVWCHVDLLFGDVLIGAVALHATDASINGGVQVTNLQDRLVKHKVVKYVTYDLPLADEEAAHRYALDQVGKPYDWRGAVGVMFPTRDWQLDDQWFCSELAAAVAIVGGVHLVNKDKHVCRIDPGMLELSPYLKLEPNPIPLNF